MTNRMICLGIFSVFVGLFSPLVQASDFHSPRTDALGGAGHAAPMLSDAVYLNNSYATYTRTHSLSFNYLTFGGGTVSTPQGDSDYYGHNINLSVLDGTQESLFQAGVGYTRRDDVSLIHVGASKGILQQLGVGLGAKFIFPNDSTGERITDATLSVTGLLGHWLQLAFIADNLIQASPSRGFYRELVLGSKINISGIFMIYLDPHYTPGLPDTSTQWGYESGAEFPFFTDLFFRIGMFRNSMVPYQGQRGNGYGIGAGWVAPRLSLDYSFSRVIDPLSSFSHNFGVTVYF